MDDGLARIAEGGHTVSADAERLRAGLAGDEEAALAALEHGHVHDFEDGRPACDDPRCCHDRRQNPQATLDRVDATRTMLELHEVGVAILAEHVYNLGRSLWSMAIRTSGDRVWERMGHPRPGDLVVERGLRAGFDPDAVGRLLRVEGDPKAPDAYVIEPLLRPGAECRWVNAEFAALPESARVNRWAKGETP